MWKRTRGRIAAFAAGTCAILLVLEVALRIVGLVQVQRIRAETADEGGAGTTILCLGDSYTHSPGVDRERTYPAQLEQLLNDRAGDDTFRVINKGQNGQNTSTLLDDLVDNLDLYQPRLVILMTGGANTWDYYGYHEFQRGAGWGSRARDLLHRVRIYRFARLAYLDATSRWEFSAVSDEMEEQGDEGGPEGPSGEGLAVDPDSLFCTEACRERAIQADEHLRLAEYDKAAEGYQAALEECPDHAILHSYAGLVCLETHRYEEALIHMERAVELGPEYAALYDRLARAYRTLDRREEAMSALIRGLETPDCDYNAREKKRLLNHVLEYAEQPESADYRLAVDLLQEAAVDRPAMAGYLEQMLAYEDVGTGVCEWVAADIGTVARTCRERGIGLVLMNYPLRYPSEWWSMYGEIAREHDLPFVDNERTFAGLGPRDAYFFPDGHCNERGNEAIARNALEVVQGVFAEVPP